jgi:hypothetical protein
MQKLYKLVKLMLVLALVVTQNISQAQNCCAECQADVKTVSDQQVLLEKIDIKEGTTITNFSSNVYVSYHSGNSQKFWANVAIATAGVAVSTQLSSTPITAGDSKTQSAISPIVPLGVTVATLPSIWKNRPRGVPQAGLYIQHRNTKGELLGTWEQPISSEAKNSAELLTVAIDKPLSEGTLEVYLQNGSKNEVYFWGLQTLKNVANLMEKKVGVVAVKSDKNVRISECPDGYLPNGQGMCCSSSTGHCIPEGEGNDRGSNIQTKTETKIQIKTTSGSIRGGCPSGYLPNGQGMCCDPFSDARCVNELPVTQSCDIVETCDNRYSRACFQGTCTDWELVSSDCSYETVCPPDGGGNTGGTGGNGGPGSGGGGNNGNPSDPAEVRDKTKQQNCSECRNSANGKYYSGLNRLKWYLTDTEIIELLSGFTEGGASAVHAAIALFAGLGFDIFCSGTVIFNYTYERADLENEHYKDIRDCNSAFGCGF